MNEADWLTHYSRGGLLQALGEGLVKMGKNPYSATLEDFAPADEFHTWRQASE
ncbi:MAG: hypothetical protein GKR94_27810 [Gammaproteobacteria bacterium]|nr:hypothetical protein [Gammaproteobacteria bacterium]